MNIGASLNKQVMRRLRAELQSQIDADALGRILHINGLKITVGSCRFDDHEATFQVKVETEGGAAVKDALLEAAMRRHGVRSKTANGYTLVDFHPNKPKYPFIYTGPQGGRYKTSPEGARQRFGRVDSQAA